MGEDFRNRLKDGRLNDWPLPEAEGAEDGVQCGDCDRVFDPAELFDGLCEDCSLEQAWLDSDPRSEDPRNEWTFVRDAAL